MSLPQAAEITEAADFLLEIGTEELPAADLESALNQISRLTEAMLDDLRLAHGEIQVFGTPRRLAVLVKSLAPRQEDLSQKVKGPPSDRAFDKDGNPTPAAVGFARSKGVDVKELKSEQIDGGLYLVADVFEPGKSFIEILPNKLAELVAGIRFDKSMRWNESGVAFSRPIRWLVSLFGEQVVLCGGVTALIRAAFETLVKAGYQPEVAYFECLHELKLIVDLLYQGGMSYMWYSVSDTAEYGGYVVGDEFENSVKEDMAGVLERIQDGTFARQWIAENENGRPEFRPRRQREHDLLLEQVGADLRHMMPFLDDKQIKQEG